MVDRTIPQNSCEKTVDLFRTPRLTLSIHVPRDRTAWRKNVRIGEIANHDSFCDWSVQCFEQPVIALQHLHVDDMYCEGDNGARRRNEMFQINLHIQRPGPLYCSS